MSVIIALVCAVSPFCSRLAFYTRQTCIMMTGYDRHGDRRLPVRGRTVMP
jgi:hypothetical protein